jgi:hypothetical protein
MSRVFQDTVFAAIVRAVLGPTYFPHIDEKDPACLRGRDHATYDKQEARAIDSGDLESSGEFSNKLTATSTFPEPGKGKEEVEEERSDSTLVTWFGPDDPEVCQGCRSFHTKLIFCEEPNELVATEKSLGHVSSLHSDLFRLLWLCSLYCWSQRRRRRISCQPRCRNSWAYIIPARVWSR